MPATKRLPSWVKVKMPSGPNYLELTGLLRENQLHTVCEEARCPNIGECWERRTATFMILGDICTRACAYCAVTSGKPTGLDLQEPIRLAETVQNMGLKYAVITSVNRDDLPDGGAFIFAQCINQIRKRLPNCDYDRSLELLTRSKMIDSEAVTKSGMMVGLGETWDEIINTMQDLLNVGCDLLTIGQYLRPTEKHIKLDRWYTPEEFEELAKQGYEMGFKHVASGPLVRSSYHADEQHSAAVGSLEAS